MIVMVVVKVVGVGLWVMGSGGKRWLSACLAGRQVLCLPGEQGKGRYAGLVTITGR